MEHASHTPADLVIHPRNLMIGRGQTMMRWWNGGDPVATAFYNGMSVAFPLGEAFFIDSVRKFRDAAPADQQAQIDAFIKQEAAHSREHIHFNKQVHEAGYEVESIEADLAEQLAKAREFPPVINLATTVALEHFTAIIAHAALKSDRHFKGATSDAARLWKWHAIEEIEHKAVAFDAFLAATEELVVVQALEIPQLGDAAVNQPIPEGARAQHGSLLRSGRHQQADHLAANPLVSIDLSRAVAANISGLAGVLPPRISPLAGRRSRAACAQ